MNKHSKYRPLMDDIQDKICNAEIGVTGLYRLMLETLDEAEQELATLKASLPKIKADAVLQAAKDLDLYSVDCSETGINVGDGIAEYVNKKEAAKWIA